MFDRIKQFLYPRRLKLLRCGLSEQRLRRMDPDARVALLEEVGLDPYDYIYLCY